MRHILFIVTVLFANTSYAVGWEEVPIDKAGEKGMSVNYEFNQVMGCQQFNISLPKKLLFKELGEREFASVKYRVVRDKIKGWQLNPKGTQVALSFSAAKQVVAVDSLCLSRGDLPSAYLSVLYGGPRGSPPIVILLHLGAN